MDEPRTFREALERVHRSAACGMSVTGEAPWCSCGFLQLSAARPQRTPPSFMQSADGLRVWALEQVDMADEALAVASIPYLGSARLTAALMLPEVQHMVAAGAWGHAAVAITEALRDG